MEKFSIRIEGIPRPQPRARPAFKGRGYLTHIDKGGKQRIGEWKSSIELECARLRLRRPFFPDQPLSLAIRFYFMRPKTGKNKEATWKMGKPDLDNLIKAVKDALNGWAYTDDSQVCQYGRMVKVYSNWNGAEVEVHSL